MNCPRCQDGEIDFSGICLICGYQEPIAKPPGAQASRLQATEKCGRMPAFPAKPEGFAIGSQVSIEPETPARAFTPSIFPFVKTEPAHDDPPYGNPAVSDIRGIGRKETFYTEEIPQWRKELAQKLQTLREKKEGEIRDSALNKKDANEYEEGEASSRTNLEAAAIRAELIERLRMRTPPTGPLTAAPQRKTLQPLPGAEMKPAALQNEQNLQSIIDEAVLRQAEPPPESSAPTSITAAEAFPLWETYKTETHEEETYADAGELIAVVNDAPPEPTDAADIPGTSEVSSFEGRLIFLSRTLSGLIDLFLIVLFSGIFLGMADYFTNAPMLNSMSAVNFIVLFLMIYFLYSIFFLGTNNQTVGMMATDLRVVGMNEKRLSMSQVVRRCAAFLVSLFGLGIGLLAGIFSKKCLCLHDRLSGTRVVRI